MNLYEINNSIMECVDMETGEIIDLERLEQLQLEREEKIENIGCWIKNLLSDADQLKTEADKLIARKRVAENKANSLKNYLQEFLAGEKFKSPKLSITYRKSESVDVPDWKNVPEDYLKYKDPEPDKTLIKKALKDGQEIAGCALVEKQNMQIK